MKDKKKGIPKDSWTFDAKVDSAVTFAINYVLPMCEEETFTKMQRALFTKIAFDNLLEITNYIQAHHKEYSFSRWLKTLRWALGEISDGTKYLHALFLEQGAIGPQQVRVAPTFEEFFNQYNEITIDYEGLYEEINRAKDDPNYEVPELYRYFTRSREPDIELFCSHDFKHKFHVEVLDEVSKYDLKITIPYTAWDLWGNIQNLWTPMDDQPDLGLLITTNSSSTKPLVNAFRNESAKEFDEIANFPEHQLIHTPYQKFAEIIELVSYAANSKNTREIGITFYRMGESNALLQSIIQATHRKIFCKVFIELKARGEIKIDLEYLRTLLNSADRDYLDVKINYSDVKVHGKMIYIDYEWESHGTQRGTVSVFSTGNYNQQTAETYTDYHYVTTDYNVGKLIHRNFETLWDSSQQALSSISNLLIKEIYAECEKGKKGRIWIRTNHLDNKRVVKALHEASRRGVDVRLIVRTTKGFHKKQLKAKTVTGRNLEHARVYAFGRKYPRVYLSSSDILFRNLYNRFETYVQINDERVEKLLLQDFLRLWEGGQPGSYGYLDARRTFKIWYAVERMFHSGSTISPPRKIWILGCPSVDQEFAEELMNEKRMKKSEKKVKKGG